MEVVTIRVQEQVAKDVSHLAQELRKTPAEVMRDLVTTGVKTEHLRLLLKRYEKKEISMRMLAAHLRLPVWRVQELLDKVSFPYSHADVQRDLRLIEMI